MVDDDFEELQRGFAPKETNVDTKKCVKLFKYWASARNHHSSSTIKMVPNNILGWLAVAFAMRTLGGLPAHFQGGFFGKPHTTRFSGVLRTLLHSHSGASRPRVSCSKPNTPLKACGNYYIQCLYIIKEKSAARWRTSEHQIKKRILNTHQPTYTYTATELEPWAACCTCTMFYNDTIITTY